MILNKNYMVGMIPFLIFGLTIPVGVITYYGVSLYQDMFKKSVQQSRKKDDKEKDEWECL